MCKYLIHYFSGTGNTYHMVKTIESELRNKGCEVGLLNIEKYKDINIKEYNFHIFCFPVYGFGTPAIMLKYISKFKITEGLTAAIVCTSAGFEGQSLSHMKHILNKNGFKVFFTDMVVYTYNWTQIVNPQSKEVEEQVFKAAEVKVIEITKKIINCEVNFKKRNIVISILSWIVFIIFNSIGRRILGKTFIADDNCINCSKCKEVCPAKTISIYNGKPRWGNNCESCQRCINICPKEAIQLSVIKLALFAISELVPIIIIIDINSELYHLPIIINIILYCIMFVMNTVIVDILISVLENISVFRKILNINYTKKYRRNIAKGFNVK